ncbi:MAG: hypothetical protein IIC74_03445 [Bacteroidetes bacterium]|nr:hypothetical protein [Bacteroidota bacterium]
MNWNKVDKVWNEFSKLKNIDLKYKERNLLNVIQSLYLINYTNEVATFSFIGILWKSTEGHNTNKTSIIVEYENRLDINNFEFENSSKIKSIFSKNKITEFEKNILKKLKKFNGNSITLKDNFIRIDADHIFSTIDEFEHVTDLISKLKTTGNKL